MGLFVISCWYRPFFIEQAYIPGVHVIHEKTLLREKNEPLQMQSELPIFPSQAFPQWV